MNGELVVLQFSSDSYCTRNIDTRYFPHDNNIILDMHVQLFSDALSGSLHFLTQFLAIDFPVG